jgi:GNAT superfamily N-acetyltransferase
MTFSATRTKLKAILPLRALFLQETNFQIRYNACHERGWTDSYLLAIDGDHVGYGSIMGRDDVKARDTVFEFFVVRPFRKHTGQLFSELLTASGATQMECQTNEERLTSLLFERCVDIAATTILFEDHTATEHAVPGAVVRRRRRGDLVFAHTVEPVGDYVVELDREIVATGGFLLHYNMPFADLYMEVREDRRRQGLATLLLQDVKKACYLAGRVPAARCGLDNVGSRGALIKAGMRVCGFLMSGRIRTSDP